jgi:hypothetical protein
MQRLLNEQITDGMLQVATLYHRLVLVVAPAGSGKTRALQDVATQLGAKVVNVSLELSQALLELTERQRPLRVGQILDRMVSSAGGAVLLLDNTELLFAPSLKQDPLRSLQQLSRRRTVVATWNGRVEEGSHLVYASPDHPEYRRYAISELHIVTTDPAL